MSLPENLRHLNVQLPACPAALAALTSLMQGAEGEASVQKMAAVIEQDMALASSMVRTVNSAMFGLLRRVETVAEAIFYLGTAEVAAITHATALRAAFEPTPAMQALWDRSTRSSLMMGRSASLLGMDTWRAHSAGLFALSGQAVLLQHLPHSYGPLMDACAGDAPTLFERERQRYGVTHGALGSALCASWGLAPDVVKYVRKRTDDPASWHSLSAPLRDLLTLGALVDAAVQGQPPLPEVAAQWQAPEAVPRWVAAVEQPMRRLASVG